VTPAAVSLATTPFMMELCAANPAFARWRESIRAAAETCEDYSPASRLSDLAELATDLPRYTGPQVLITDALS
jgi:hypothetical protein